MAYVGLSGRRPAVADGAWGLVAVATLSMLAIASACVADDTAADAAPQPRRSHIQPVGELAAAERSTVGFGIHVSRPPDVLRKQLALDPHVGLVIDAVAEQSPAAGAGLEQHDVLLSIDGQMLIVPEQAAALLAGTGAAAPRECTIIRNGARMTLSLVPGSTKMPLPTSASPSPAAVTPATRADRALKPATSALAVLPSSRPGTAPRRTVTSGIVRQTADNTLAQTDSDFSLTISRTDETRLVVCDARGRTLFNGAIETPEQRSRIPLATRDRVEKLELLLDNQVASRPPADATDKARPVAEIGRLDIVPIEVR